MFDFIWNLGAFIIALGLLITVHEYGHFWVARRCGVKVERFSIGFGKALWRKVGKDGTEYVVAGIPLGGYVKMLDSRIDDVPADMHDQAFDKKSVGQRMAIIAAGPFANFAFAIVALWLMHMIGTSAVKPIVGSVEPDSVAYQAGLPKRAEIIAIAGERTRDWNAVNLALVEHIGDDMTVIRVKDPESTMERDIQVDLKKWSFDPEKESTLSSLGIKPFRPETTMELATVAKGSAAEKWGLLPGDRVTGIERTDIYDWSYFVEIVRLNPGNKIEILIERDGYEMLMDVTPDAKKDEEGYEIGYLGVSPKVNPWPEEYLIELKYDPFESIVRGAEKTWQLVRVSFAMIGKLIVGDVSVKNLSGPISIAQGAGNSAGYGIVYFLSFLALISVNLGVINLLPLPILDGGHLFYYTIELIRRKPVSERTQEIGFKIGAVILFLLMSIAIVNDIARL